MYRPVFFDAKAYFTLFNKDKFILLKKGNVWLPPN